MHDNLHAVHLFRIAQEAVGNATRHAHARNIIIALEASDGDLSMRVSDDGNGFDLGTAGARAGGGMGLNTMRYRARTLGGELEIYPNSPTGTVVACTVHYSAKAAVPATLEPPEINAALPAEIEPAYAHRH